MENICEYQIIKEANKKESINVINNINEEEKKSNNKLNLINDVILNNYLNTINIGYNKDFDDDYNNDEMMDNFNNECEPIPSFLLCLHKEKEKK